MAREKPFRFESEAAMCQAFIQDAARQGWDAYPETAGFDIVLVHRKTGLQCAVEAKQSLNAHVVLQVLDSWEERSGPDAGPDFRAVLVPEGGHPGLDDLACRLGVTVIRARGEPDINGKIKGSGHFGRTAFRPELPKPALHDAKSYSAWEEKTWPQQMATRQITLPDYVPDVSAGRAAPVALTQWKIRAIKIVVLLQRRGYVTPEDFTALKISPSRWRQQGWIKRVTRNRWEIGSPPDFRAQHPVNFDQIAEDYETWSADLPKQTLDQGVLNV